ncbi:hypothetical protein BMON_1908 [Bifidobacterium mongoliense DSM 21395]|uniref:Uncharacterized protein n=1 Tax=Bifidobacterium mongoliense DSM 21395 TaxID=1437603 RepID=A0A087CA84_9BIFI|nr:hypothetical protein BMON_1908 [Bifidobacterium mongoliense DSM 21395]
MIGQRLGQTIAPITVTVFTAPGPGRAVFRTVFRAGLFAVHTGGIPECGRQHTLQGRGQRSLRRGTHRHVGCTSHGPAEWPRDGCEERQHQWREQRPQR